MLTAPLYSAFVDDREIASFFLLDQKMEPEPKLSMYPEVDLLSVLLSTQIELVNTMRSNAQPVAQWIP